MQPDRNLFARLSLLLPLVLSVLPVLILGADVSRAKDRQRLDAQRAWTDETRLVGDRLREVTTPAFWVENAVRRLRTRVESTQAAQSGTAADLQRELASALPEITARLNPPASATGVATWGAPLLWAAPAGQLVTDQSVTLFSGPGFQTQYRSAFVDLLRELGAGDTSPVDTVRAEARAKRMRTILGAGVTTQLFLPAEAGRPFWVIYQQQPGVAVWDIVRASRGGRRVPLAAFVLIVPLPAEPAEPVLRATCRHWQDLLGSRGQPPCWPAFLPLPDTAAANAHQAQSAPAGPMIAHPRLHAPDAAPLWSELRRHLSIQHSTDPGLPPSVHLLGSAVGQVVERNGWWATACSTDPSTARVGVLMAPAPRLPTLPGEWLVRAARVAVGLGWALYLGTWWLRGRPMVWGVRGTLTLWFLGLAATPLALVVGAGERLNTDLVANLQDSLDRRLLHVGQRIESGSVVVDHHSWRGARSVARHPQLRRLLPLLKRNPRQAERLVTACWERCERLGMDPILVVLTDGDTMTEHRCQPRADAGVITATVRMYHGMAREWLRNKPERERRAREARARAGKALPSDAKPIETTYNSRDDFATTNANTLAEAGGITTFNYGGHNTIRFFDIVRGPAGVNAALFIVWNPESAGRRYVKAAIHRAYLQQRDCYLAAFRIDGIRLRTVERAGDPAGLALLERDVRSWGIPAATVGHRRQAFSGSRLPGYLWVVGSPTDAIATARTRESQRLAMAVVLLGLLVVTVAALLARWLAAPIVRMSDGLQRIASGDVTRLGLGEGRTDELGESGTVLDTMTGWLAERQVMSRFVAPQVLSVVEEVDAAADRPGEIREAVALVSDIRGFTGISETHPPAAVFAMINRHIERMTRVIHHHGGVIDRFIGDAIQAVFYADAQGEAANRALRAADEMCREHRRLVAERRQQNLFGYEIGVGLELGRIVTGVIGDANVRLDLSALGEPMQTAAELESASRHVPHRPIVCSFAVRVRADPDFSFAPLPAGAGVDGAVFVGATGHEATGNATVSGSDRPGRAGRPDAKPDPALGSFALPETDVSGGHPWPQTPTTPAVLAGARRSSDPEPAPRATPTDSPAGDATVADGAALASSRRAAGLSVQLIVLLIVWLLPLLAVHDAGLRARADDEQRRLQTTAARLDDDWTRCERILDPNLPIAVGLQRWVARRHQVATHTALLPESAFRAAMVASMSADLAALRRRWPSLTWAIATVETTATPAAWATPAITLIAGDTPQGATEPQALPWAEAIAQELAPSPRIDLFRPDAEWARMNSETLSPARVNRRGWGKLVRVAAQGRETLQFWMPLRLPSTAAPRPAAAGNWQHVRSRLWGLLMVWVDPGDLGPAAACRFLGGQLAAEGCAAAFVPTVDAATLSTWLHPQFRRDKSLYDVLLSGREGLHHSATNGHWQTIVRHGLFGLPYRLVLARPVPDETPGGHALTRAWIVTWWLIGGLALVRILLGMAPPRLPLRWQMGGAFLLVLLPALMLGFITFERSFAARRVQIEAQQRQALAGAIDDVDNARQIYLNWYCAAANRMVEHPAFLDRLLAIESLPRQHQASAAHRLMDAFVETQRRHGIVAQTPGFSGYDNFFVEVRNAQKKTINQFIYNVLRQYGNRAMQQMGQRALTRGENETAAELQARTNRELVNGMFIDDTRSVLLGLMSPGNFSHITVAPRVIAEFVNFGEPIWAALTHLRHPDGYRYCFQMTIDTAWLDALWCRVSPAMARGLDRDPHPIAVAAGPAEFPAMRCVPPYAIVVPDRVLGGLDAAACLDAQPPPLAEQAVLAPGAFTPIVRRVGRGADEVLVMTRPGRTMTRLVLTATVPLGRLLAANDAEQTTARWILAVLLLASLALALQAAAAFLEPVADLNAAARAIMTGQFSVRLPAHAGVEFAALAQAFNAMAAGVESGRRLSRFVSGSVRDAARDAERHQLAVAGEQRTAVVMFTGIGGFAQLARTVAAPDLIDRANRHLRALSPVIRAHGGDIDKFIGDKILAVFPVDPALGPGPAMRAAVAAAVAMQQLARAGEPWQQPLGIGIVLGDVLAGIMGTSEVRLEFTVIGDTVNLASRLADIAMKLDGTGALDTGRPTVGGTVIDDTAWQALSPAHAAWQRLRLPPIRGKARAVGAHWLPPH